MSKNGKTEVEEQQQLDTEHELPPAQEPSEVKKLRAERDSLLDRLARLQADFENARKRGAKEQQEYRDYALADAIKALIPVMDSFDRALQTSPEKSEFHLGVELIHKQLQDALGKIGVRQISAKGEQFDPRFHEAIEMVDTEDFDDHQVIEQLQTGYKLKDRLLRPAIVKVARSTRR